MATTFPEVIGLPGAAMTFPGRGVVCRPNNASIKLENSFMSRILCG